MHIERTGHGPDLVLLHGWAMHGGIFAPLVEALRRDWTVHVVDLPGHGASREDATPLRLPELGAALVEALPPAVWLGWSLGGLVAQHVAIRHPDRVHGLATIASAPCFVAGEDWPYGVAPAVLAQFGANLGNDWRGTVDGFLALEVIGSRHAQEELRTLRASVFERGEPAPRVLAEGLDLLRTADVRAGIAGLAVPSLWIAGRRDRLVPAGAIARAAALAPGGRHLEIPDAGHAPFLHNAGAIATAIGRLAGDAA
jgi:pimeloyl-[acyl-carrier protein] methyl ester esterase